MTDPSFTVAIAAYNAAATLGATVESVLAQTRTDFEAIIVDDGSTDETAARAQSFATDPRVRVIRQENRGLPAARNAALEQAKGRYVAVLDSDDLWMPEYLERLGAALESNPKAGLAYTDAWSLSDETRRIQRESAMAPFVPRARIPQGAQALLLLLLHRNFIYGSAMVPRRVLDHVGMFDPSLPAAEDFELWLRILSHGYPAVRAPGRLAIQRQRRDSMSRDAPRMYAALREVWRLVAEKHPAPPEAKQLARARMKWAERELAIAEGRRWPARLVGYLRWPRDAIRWQIHKRRAWYRDPPAEVTRAFPDLDAI